MTDTQMKRTRKEIQVLSGILNEIFIETNGDRTGPEYRHYYFERLKLERKLLNQTAKETAS